MTTNQRFSMTLYMILSGGEMRAPEGVLYAALMAKGVTLNEFQSALGVLKRAGLVKSERFLLSLTATGIVKLRELDEVIGRARRGAEA